MNTSIENVLLHLDCVEVALLVHRLWNCNASVGKDNGRFTYSCQGLCNKQLIRRLRWLVRVGNEQSVVAYAIAHRVKQACRTPLFLILFDQQGEVAFSFSSQSLWQLFHLE